MKYLAVVSMVLASFVQADPQINFDEQYCHVPQNTQNSDDEYFLVTCGDVRIDDDGLAQGAGERRRARLADIPVYFGHTYRIGSTENHPVYIDAPCTMTVNGTAYTTQDWWMTIKGVTSRGTHADVTIECLDGEAQ